MIVGEPLALPPEAAEAAKSYLRIGPGIEDELVAALVQSAAELCESFTGQALIARGFTETLSRSGGTRAWQRLGRTPVRSITSVERITEQGAPAPLPAGHYAVDIDGNGDGWVRVDPGSEPKARVTYEAGLGLDWGSVPAPLRQGIVRLAAHFFTHRSGEASKAAAEPPAAVTALWRPYRRMRLG